LVQKRLLLKNAGYPPSSSSEQTEEQTREIAPKRDEFRTMTRIQDRSPGEKKAAEKLQQREQATSHPAKRKLIEKAEKASERYPDFQSVVSNRCASTTRYRSSFPSPMPARTWRLARTRPKPPKSPACLP
jgi:hypothetical protein